MVNGDIQEKIKEILSSAKSCALLCEENPNEEAFLLKSALELALRDLEKDIIVFPKEISHREEKWRFLLQKNESVETPAKTIIKIPKKEISVKELSYNEDGDFFSLVITSQKGRITKELAIFEEALPEPDAVFCFFEENEKLESFRSLIKIPEKENIIYLTASKQTLTEKIANLFQFLNIDFSPFISNLLFSALIIETNNFRDYSNKEIFSLANFLLSRGAEGNLIKEIMEKEKTNSFVRLTGRAMARSHYDETAQIRWSFLAEKDFERTETVPNSRLIPGLVKELEKIKEPSKISVFCWQDNGVFAFLKTLEKSLLLNLAKKLNTSLQSDYIIAGPFQNFSEAEIKIKEAIEN